MGQANCCWRSREALTDAEAVLSTDVRLTRGRKRSERRLLLLQEELVVAKLQHGTTLRPQLRLALDQLWVLSSGKQAAGEVKEEEEESSDEDGTSIVLIWPTGTCVATFGSRELKQLWVGKLLGTPEGAKGARVTSVPSIKLLQKELSRHRGWRTFSARSLQRLMEGQAEADPKQGPPTAPSTKGGGLCRSAAGESGGSTSRRRRGLPWPFALRRSPAAAPEPGQAGSGCSRVLFGQPLAALCGEAGTLPRPIQELLDILHQRGPSTEGIFRRADRTTALQKLKEALDRGADVDLPSQSVILLAAVLKVSASALQLEELLAGLESSKAHLKPLALQDFLRSIPGKLLVTELYQDWVQAMERPSRQARVEELKVVAEKLPAAHLLLLKRLLPLLQSIGHHVSTSRMTSSNLAICLGPNLLGPPDEDLLPLEAMLEVTEKVKLLVEFLIENGSDIFGEEMAGQMSPAPMDRSTELPLEKQHGPAGESDAEEQQAKAFPAAPASLLVLQRAAGGDEVVGAETAEAPVALSPTSPETMVDCPGCAEELKSLSEHRRFAGSIQKNDGQRKRKREETWAEERPCHQAKKRREEKKGTEKKREGAKGQEAPGADFPLLVEPL
ncbi:unnamed protein product [Bubo scandiacus]